MKAADLFSPAESLALFAEIFNPEAAPWEWLAQIKNALASPAAQKDFARPLPELPANFHIEGPVYIGANAKLSPNATIIGPAWIGDNCEIRQGAYIRGNVIVGAHTLVGNSVEIKNSLLLEHVQVPHFNYVGDSILGNYSHIGAGVIFSNLRLDQKNITVQTAGGAVNTGLRKLGALLGDRAEAGCNSVLNPGTILGRRSLVMPTLSFTGTLPENTIAREKTNITKLPRRD